MVAGILVPQEQRGEFADDDDEVAGLHEVASLQAGANHPRTDSWPKPVVEASYSNWFKIPCYITGKITGNFALPMRFSSLNPNGSSPGFAGGYLLYKGILPQALYATEQGIFGGITGNFFHKNMRPNNELDLRPIF